MEKIGLYEFTCILLGESIFGSTISLRYCFQKASPNIFVFLDASGSGCGHK